MPQFHETMYGQSFFTNQLPRLIKALERIATALEEQNKPPKDTHLDNCKEISTVLYEKCRLNKFYRTEDIMNLSGREALKIFGKNASRELAMGILLHEGIEDAEIATGAAEKWTSTEESLLNLLLS